MTERIPLDDLTSDQLDALYDRAEGAEAARDRNGRSRDRWAAHAGRLQERTLTAEARVTELEAELVTARSTIDRVQAATTALADQATGFLAHHNPDCECSWGEALAQAARRVQAALNDTPATA